MSSLGILNSVSVGKLGSRSIFTLAAAGVLARISGVGPYLILRFLVSIVFAVKQFFVVLIRVYLGAVAE